MKKQTIIILMTLFCITEGYAYEGSIGGGIGLERYTSTINVEYLGQSETHERTMNRFVLEGFIETTYVQVGIGYVNTLSGEVSNSSTSADLDITYTHLSLHMYGKYPIEMKGFVLFPMVGFEYMANLEYKDHENNDEKSDLTEEGQDNLNEFWVKLGLGGDFDLNESSYIRITGMFGYKFQSEYEKSLIKDYITDNEDDGLDISWTTMDVEFGVSIGFRL